MRNNYLKVIWCLLLFYCVSCDDKDSSLGLDWIDESTRTILIDTCSVRLSTVLLYDSINTSNDTVIYAGNFHDQNLGTTRAKSFLTFDPTLDFINDLGIDIRVKYCFDSLTLRLKRNGLYYGDTVSNQTIKVHRLKEKVELNEGYLYNTSSFEYDEVPLGSKTFRPKPVSGEKIEIRLSDELGKEFLDKLHNQDEDMENISDFYDYFNGLVVVPDNNSSLIMGFEAVDTTCVIRLYYHTVKALPESHYAEFPLENALHFNQVLFDRSGTPLEKLNKKSAEIESSETGNMAFVQGLSGIFTRIEFPYLNRIQELGDHGNVISAKLIIYPVQGSYGRGTPIPSSLEMYTSDEKDATTGTITDSNESKQTGNLFLDDLFPYNTSYTFDITSFVDDQVGKFGVYKQNLQLALPEIRSTLGALTLGDKHHVSNRIALKITYSIYNER
ncbi:MAG: DUF4270 family protein [Bacteroidales bacterium]|nr:DUF4270 family protein [Bacteroidales bacterium]